jgi:hypothetical protein
MTSTATRTKAHRAHAGGIRSYNLSELEGNGTSGRFGLCHADLTTEARAVSDMLQPVEIAQVMHF